METTKGTVEFIEESQMTVKEFMNAYNIDRLQYKKSIEKNSVFFTFGPRRDQVISVSRKIQNDLSKLKRAAEMVISRVVYKDEAGNTTGEGFLMYEEGNSSKIETNAELDITL